MPFDIYLTWELYLADSSQYVCIEDCYISVGDDAIAIKSGWDEYGTAYGMPSQHIDIRRIVVHSETSAGIAFGSEMSGGISDVKVSKIWLGSFSLKKLQVLSAFVLLQTNMIRKPGIEIQMELLLHVKEPFEQYEHCVLI